MTPAGTSNELCVQNEWEENTHTHTHTVTFYNKSAGTFYCVYVYVCLCFLPIHSGHQVRWTYHTNRGHTGLLFHLLSVVRALIFLAKRIQPFLSLVDREVACFFFKKIFSEKNPVCRDRTHVPTCQKVTWLPLGYRGDRLKFLFHRLKIQPLHGV